MSDKGNNIPLGGDIFTDDITYGKPAPQALIEGILNGIGDCPCSCSPTALRHTFWCELRSDTDDV